LEKVPRQSRVPAPSVLRVSNFTFVATWKGFVHVTLFLTLFGLGVRLPGFR
jgi:putative transposase